MWRVRKSLFLSPILVLTLAAGACGLARTPAPSPAPAPTWSSQPTQQPPQQPVTSAPVPRSSSPAAAVLPRTLMLGMRGADVRQLQTRLAALGYYPGPADGRFGQNTLEALWAFQAVQGVPVTGNAGPVTRRALEHPRQPDELVPSGGSQRVEVDLSRQVLVLYRSGRVQLISHISSGGGYSYCSPSGCGRAITPTGDFRTTAFMPGWVTVPLGQMYNPVFFIGTSYAIHGSASVPLAPVSHGCVRIPMVIAEFFHKLVLVPGTPVYIRG
jgi:lipoprotein-anchoring transpeptidase ErfK/SrfK